MKLSKKRISILVSLICLLFLLVFTLCSFDLPDYPHAYSEMLVTSGISSQDLTNILGIFQFQDLCGQFNSLVPLCIFRNGGRILALFCVPSYTLTFSVTLSNNIYYYSFGNETSTNSTFILIGLSDQGFSVYSTAYTGQYNVVRANCLYFRSSFDSNLVLNSYFTTDSSTVNPDISSVFSYWDGYASRLSGSGSGASPEELESAYDSGFADGFDSGYFDGLESGLEWGEELGYQKGYTDGVGTGYSEGYQQGEAAGYETGYEDGFSDGYETGYDSGYSEAERETVIEYVEPFEIDIGRVISGISSVPDNIMNGSFDFDLFGINVYGLLKLLIILFVVSAIVVFIIKRAS